jgi:ATP-binding cassette, subfamily B, bacterial
MRIHLRALSYFRADRGRLALLVGSILAQTGVAALKACPLAVLVDCVLGDAAPRGWMARLFLSPLPADRSAQIAGLTAATLGLHVAYEGLGAARTWLGHRIGYAGVLRVRAALFEKLQGLCLSFHHTLAPGDAMQRLSEDAAGFHALLQAFVSVAVSAVSLGVMTAIMLSLSVRLTLLSLAIAPVLVATNLFFARTFERRYDTAKALQGEVLTTFGRSMATIGLAQAFGRERDELDRFEARAGSSARAWLSLHRAEVAYGLSVGAAFAASGAAILGYGATLAQGGRMTLGALTVFLAYLSMLYAPLCTLSGAASSVQAGAAGARRIFEILDRAPSVADRPGARALAVRPRCIELRDVAFAYRPDRPVLAGASATIRPGEMVAFIGASGTGKSTLLRLLSRFHDPGSGSIRLGGHDLRDVKLEDARRHVAVVFQDSLVLPASVAENIAYGRPSATMDEVRRAAEMAGAASFIAELPEGFATRLDESGQRLSGGQLQRLAIARALISEAPILVLDEPTSALDGEHERRIIETLKALKGERTILLVSHRLQSVAACDQIFVMEGGRFVERGTYRELLARRGVFQRMARPAGELTC